MHWIAEWFSRYGVAIATAVSALASIGAYGDTAPLPSPAANVQPQTPQVSPQQQLLDRVNALETEVKQLRADAADRPKPKYDSRDVDRTIDAVIQDAGRHTLRFPPSGSSGHDLGKGFYIKSDDGNFSIYPDLLFQFRGVANYREDAKHGDDGSTESGFEIRRAKFGFYGTAFSPDFSYRFLWQNVSSAGNIAVQYAYAQYIFAHDVLLPGGELAVRGGQFKNIVFKEEFTPDRAQLMVERSVINGLVGGASIGSETQGVDVILTGKNNPLHVDVLLDDGIKTSNTDFRDNQPVTVTNSDGTTTTSQVATNFGVAGRVDYKVFGDWGDTDDLTGVWGRADLLDIGGGVDFSEGDHNNALHYTVDVQYQLLHKLALFAAFYGDWYDFRNQPATAPGSRTDYGFEVEAGYFLTRSIQPIARYSLTRLDGKFKGSSTDTVHEITGGVNWFFGPDGRFGNRAKITFDVTYLPNGTPAFNGGDYLPTTDSHDEWVARGQFQLSL